MSPGEPSNPTPRCVGVNAIQCVSTERHSQPATSLIITHQQESRRTNEACTTQEHPRAPENEVLLTAWTGCRGSALSEDTRHRSTRPCGPSNMNPKHQQNWPTVTEVRGSWGRTRGYGASWGRSAFCRIWGGGFMNALDCQNSPNRTLRSGHRSVHDISAQNTTRRLRAVLHRGLYRDPKA